MEHQAKVGERDAVLVMSKRFPVRLSTIGGAIGAAFGDAYRFVGAGGTGTEGMPFVIYHGMPVGDEPFDVEVCVPVAGSTEPVEGWRLQELPAGSFATLVHVGPYADLGRTYEALTAWVAAHDLVVAGPPREVYLTGPDVPQSEARTVVEFPVTRAPAGVVAG